MDDAAGVAALVAGGSRLALEHDDRGSRVAQCQFAGGRQADDAGTDYREVAARSEVF